MAKLHFRYGTMGSAKTALAVMHAHNIKEKGNFVILCKPDTDTRTKEVWSRTGLKSESISVSEMLNLSHEEIAKNKTIIVDEAQFMTPQQVEKLASIVDIFDIPAFCYGLRTDYTSHLFPGAKRLMEIADEIEEIKTTCWCGKSAKFNARIVDGNIAREPLDSSTIDIENKIGNQKYTALCREHYFKNMPTKDAPIPNQN